MQKLEAKVPKWPARAWSPAPMPKRPVPPPPKAMPAKATTQEWLQPGHFDLPAEGSGGSAETKQAVKPDEGAIYEHVEPVKAPVPGPPTAEAKAKAAADEWAAWAAYEGFYVGGRLEGRDIMVEE